MIGLETENRHIVNISAGLLLQIATGAGNDEKAALINQQIRPHLKYCIDNNMNMNALPWR